MTTEERTQAAGSFLADANGGWARNALAAEIARERHFRPKTLNGMSDPELANMAARIDVRSHRVLERALSALHLSHRRQMLVQFMTSVEFPHDDGVLREDASSVEPVPAERLVPAADSLLGDFASDQVLLYLLSLIVIHPRPFGHLDAWLVSTASTLGGSGASSSAPRSVTKDRSDEAPSPSDTLEFTTLDRRTIMAIVECVAGVSGAPSRREIDDLVLELVDLNAARHQSFFHLGFRDSLFERDAAASLPADNESRRRWYWAGFISGLARLEAWTSIVSLFDMHPAVRSLGEKWDGAAFASAWLVFKALCKADRYAQAGVFPRPEVIAGSSQLRGALHVAAIELIRGNRAVEALPMLVSLEKALERIDDPDEDDERLLVEVRRRKAICLRQTGEVEEALKLLGTLAEIPDPVLNAIIRSDMGLIRARAQRLGDLVIPPEKLDVGPFIDRLALGESDFLAAVAGPELRSAHANFALGVLRLAQGRYSEAVTRLDEALAYFKREPEVYRRDGTLASAHLYLGIAICQALEDLGRFPRACELIREGLRGGAAFPLWLLASTVDHLALERSELAQDATATILQEAGEHALEAILTSTSAEQSPAVESALFARAANPSRPASQRASDYRTVLPWLLANGDTSRAEDALDYLEEQALVGVGRAEFMSLLERPEALSPAWDIDGARESRICLLESEGRFEEAALLGAQIFYRLLATREEYDLDAAILLVEHLRGYGPAASETLSQLEPVVDARRRESEETNDADPAKETGESSPVTILIVGGNEQHARMHEALEEECAESCPGVTLEYLHTGWSGNWATYASEFERRASRADGVVMLALMRTMLGRRIRERCPVPWRGCRGRGRGEILNTVRRVAPMARRVQAERCGREVG